MKLFKYLAAFTSLTFFTGLEFSANAITINKMTELNSPTDITEGQFERNDNLFFFKETTNLELTRDIPIDITPSSVGTTFPSSCCDDKTDGGGIIPEGTKIDSYYVFHDPVDDGPNTISGASITVDQDILGLQTIKFTDQGTASKFEGDDLISPGVTFNSTRAYNENPDALTYESSRKIVFDTTRVSFSNAQDSVRIITASSQSQASQPVPFEAEGTMGLLALGGFFGYRYLKKRKQTLAQESNN